MLWVKLISDDKQKEVINLADTRMAMLFKKKLQGDYESLYDESKGEK